MTDLSHKDSANTCPVHWLALAVATVGILVAQYLGADLLNQPFYLGALAFGLVSAGMLLSRKRTIEADSVVPRETVDVGEPPTVEEPKSQPVESHSLAVR